MSEPCPYCGQALPERRTLALDPTLRALGRALVDAVMEAQEERARAEAPHPDDPHRTADGRFISRGGP